MGDKMAAGLQTIYEIVASMLEEDHRDIPLAEKLEDALGRSGVSLVDNHRLTVLFEMEAEFGPESEELRRLGEEDIQDEARLFYNDLCGATPTDSNDRPGEEVPDFIYGQNGP